MKNLLLKWLVGKNFAELVKGYKLLKDGHHSVPVGTPTSWSWGRAGLSELEFAAGKLLKGAGVNVNPAEEATDESCRACHLATQSIPDTTWTTLSLADEDWDTNNIHDLVTNNSRLTCKVAGKYVVWSWFQWETNSTGRRLGRILKNGTTTESQQEATISTAATFGGIMISTIIVLAVNDYIELQAYQNIGGALSTYYTAGEIPTQFGMHRLL